MCRLCQLRIANAKRATRHHRKCHSNRGTDDKNNISIVRNDKHEAFHLLFQNMGAIEIANELTRTWIDPDWQLIAQRR